MSSTHHARAYLRNSPPTVKKSAVRGVRSTLSSRSTASHKLASRGNKSKNKLEQEKERGKQNKEGEEEVEGLGQEGREDMGTSFLQYCAMCEKQIVVPSNSILYCSESCRRKDASDTPAAVPYLSLFNPTFQNHAVGHDSDFVLRLKVGTIFRRQEMTLNPTSPRIPPPMAHEGKSDLDPSEWKPNLTDRTNSEAFHYLGQFHRSSATLQPIRRPTLQTRGTLVSAAITTPSLSHTPATSTSSDESVAGTPYEFVTRPLLPRLDPKYCNSVGIKSVDLVTPHIPLALIVSTNNVGINANPVTHPDGIGSESGASGNVSFEKQCVVQRSSIAVGSLKKLLEIGCSTAGISSSERAGSVCPSGGD